MNVLFLSPEFPDTFWGFKHALRFIRRKAAYPPLGLITVASMLPAHWTARLVDLNVRQLTEADLDWADLAFVGAMVVQRNSSRAVIARCKRARVPVVAGGPLFTVEHEQFPEVDHFVLNEAEVTLQPFLADLARGRAQRVYASSEYADLSMTPVPAWDLLDLDSYASMCVEFARGCPYDCDFCNVTALLGHRPRAKRVEQILVELEALRDRGWRGAIFFVDDNLIGNRRLVKSELLPALIAWRSGKRGCPFIAQVSMNLADDPDLLRQMAAAGFDSVFIGIETPDDEALAECHKQQNVGRSLLDDIRRIQAAGLEVSAGFIVGFDSDTPETFRRQIEFIQRSGIATAMVGLLQAPAGTRLYERMKREGRLLGSMTGDNVDGTTNIVPRMDPELLREGYRSLLKHIYAPSQYYARLKTFLRIYRNPSVAVPIEFRHLVAFALAAGRLGLIGEERGHYWRLMAWTLCHRPRLLPRMVLLAIFGFNHRRVVELQIGAG
jgi:radical SAM superfamily enzyme YgiQ (UPF0313 family)